MVCRSHHMSSLARHPAPAYDPAYRQNSYLPFGSCSSSYSCLPSCPLSAFCLLPAITVPGLPFFLLIVLEEMARVEEVGVTDCAGRADAEGPGKRLKANLARRT